MPAIDGNTAAGASLVVVPVSALYYVSAIVAPDSVFDDSVLDVKSR